MKTLQEYKNNLRKLFVTNIGISNNERIFTTDKCTHVIKVDNRLDMTTNTYYNNIERINHECLSA